jgi:catechol 2,3-dioxygenase-like lactoylglutathione lyase family enzyme
MSNGGGAAVTVPRVSGLLETALYVEDLARARDFYQSLMGFELFFEDARMVALGVPAGAVLLLFRRGGSVGAVELPGGTIPGHDASGKIHVAFAIPWGELSKWEAHLEVLGVAVTSRMTWPRGGTSLYFDDPDGNVVEVATPGLWPNY